MKVTLTETIKDYENNPVVERDVELTYRDVFATALNNSPANEPMMPGDKAKAFRLTQKVFAKKELDISLSDATFIKERVGKLYSPLVYGRVCNVLGDNLVGDETDTKDSPEQ